MAVPPDGIQPSGTWNVSYMHGDLRLRRIEWAQSVRLGADHLRTSTVCVPPSSLDVALLGAGPRNDGFTRRGGRWGPRFSDPTPGPGFHVSQRQLQHRGVTSQRTSVRSPQPHHDAIRVVEMLARQREDFVSALEVAQADAARRARRLMCEATVIPRRGNACGLQNALDKTLRASPGELHQVGGHDAVVSEDERRDREFPFVDKRILNEIVEPLDRADHIQSPPQRGQEGGRRHAPQLRLHLRGMTPDFNDIAEALGIADDAANQHALQGEKDGEEQQPVLMLVLQKDGTEGRDLRDGVQEVGPQFAAHTRPRRARQRPATSAQHVAPPTPPFRALRHAVAPCLEADNVHRRLPIAALALA
mmetsp:Transcript_20942/g.60459  ORF Transcript_20942/g.60459 Transcript_20942/m.60459 type:complete len:361 (+) Transcript_20942:309-1391(+)